MLQQTLWFVPIYNISTTENRYKRWARVDAETVYIYTLPIGIRALHIGV